MSAHKTPSWLSRFFNACAKALKREFRYLAFPQLLYEQPGAAIAWWIFRCGQIFFQSSCNSALMRMSQITNANDSDQSAVSVFQHEREFVSLRLRRSLLFISSLLNAFAIFWLFCLAEIYLVDSVIHRLNKRGQEFAVYDSCIRVKE